MRAGVCYEVGGLQRGSTKCVPTSKYMIGLFLHMVGSSECDDL